MLDLKPVRKKYGDYICRRCLNKEYKVDLQPKDCDRYYYGHCRCCKEDRRLVVSFTPIGKIKMLLK